MMTYGGPEIRSWASYVSQLCVFLTVIGNTWPVGKWKHPSYLDEKVGGLCTTLLSDGGSHFREPCASNYVTPFYATLGQVSRSAQFTTPGNLYASLNRPRIWSCKILPGWVDLTVANKDSNVDSQTEQCSCPLVLWSYGIILPIRRYIPMTIRFWHRHGILF